MSIYLPPRVSRELAERTASYNADVLRSIVVDDSDPILRDFSELLQRIHPRLIMVRAQEQVVPGVAMKPGHYHILVRTDGAPWNCIPIEGEDGEFVVPTSRVFTKLAEGDMTERRNLERWAAAQRDERDSAQAELARNRAERRGHLKELIDAYSRASVSMTDATPWRQNQAGRRDVGSKP